MAALQYVTFCLTRALLVLEPIYQMVLCLVPLCWFLPSWHSTSLPTSICILSQMRVSRQSWLLRCFQAPPFTLVHLLCPVEDRPLGVLVTSSTCPVKAVHLSFCCKSPWSCKRRCVYSSGCNRVVNELIEGLSCSRGKKGGKNKKGNRNLQLLHCILDRNIGKRKVEFNSESLIHPFIHLYPLLS